MASEMHAAPATEHLLMSKGSSKGQAMPIKVLLLTAIKVAAAIQSNGHCIASELATNNKIHQTQHVFSAGGPVPEYVCNGAVPLLSPSLSRCFPPYTLSCRTSEVPATISKIKPTKVHHRLRRDRIRRPHHCRRQWSPEIIQVPALT